MPEKDVATHEAEPIQSYAETLETPDFLRKSAHLEESRRNVHGLISEEADTVGELLHLVTPRLADVLIHAHLSECLSPIKPVQIPSIIACHKLVHLPHHSHRAAQPADTTHARQPHPNVCIAEQDAAACSWHPSTPCPISPMCSEASTAMHHHTTMNKASETYDQVYELMPFRKMFAAGHIGTLD